jgi:hypothetical protein
VTFKHDGFGNGTIGAIFPVVVIGHDYPPSSRIKQKNMLPTSPEWNELCGSYSEGFSTFDPRSAFFTITTLADISPVEGHVVDGDRLVTMTSTDGRLVARVASSTTHIDRSMLILQKRFRDASIDRHARRLNNDVLAHSPVSSKKAVFCRGKLGWPVRKDRAPGAKSSSGHICPRPLPPQSALNRFLKTNDDSP